MRNLKLPLLGLVLALVAVACGGGNSASDTTTSAAPTTAATTAAPTTAATAAAPTTAATTTPTTADPGAEPREVKINAVDSEGFSLDRIRMKVGETITVTFENKDNGGEPHNIHVSTDTEELATTIETGPDTQSLTFTINTAGEFPFICDTHLEQMRGVVIVTEP